METVDLEILDASADESCKVNENCCEDFEDACPLHAYFADFHVNNQSK